MRSLPDSISSDEKWRSHACAPPLKRTCQGQDEEDVFPAAFGGVQRRAGDGRITDVPAPSQTRRRKELREERGREERESLSEKALAKLFAGFMEEVYGGKTVLLQSSLNVNITHHRCSLFNKAGGKAGALHRSQISESFNRTC